MRPRRLKNEINVVPYIDVMLVLLVIFMVATPMMTGSVDLPSTGKSSQKPDKFIRIEVKSDNGRVTIQTMDGKSKEISLKELPETLNDLRANEETTAVLIAGDKTARYESVLDVLDQVKGLDFKKVGLETNRK